MQTPVSCTMQVIHQRHLKYTYMEFLQKEGTFWKCTKQYNFLLPTIKPIQIRMWSELQQAIGLLYSSECLEMVRSFFMMR